VSIVHVSNALGTVNNINKIIELARIYNPEIKIMIDGSQAVVHQKVNIQALDCDFYAFTGHKLYGPSGIGVLVGKSDILNTMPPYQGGGDMIDRVTKEDSTYKSSPHRFEAGTPAIIEVLGLGAAVDYLVEKNVDITSRHEQSLLDYAISQIQMIDGIKIYGQAPEKAAILSFTLSWAHPSDIAMILDQCGVAVRSGHHCCMPLMQKFGIEGTVRASFGLYNTYNDIDVFIEGLHKAKGMLA
jgi:cysteine desulfurase/selenocysteine lyase